ncbi:LLM class F420-dependent oxidoreductase [Homoserinimonas hongtaonis]|uniref:LLM class F420-dependent oxidoreductase n=1 Tax=Homoserinimonas hongtaonis TaxID=2079791 RepID=A0A2U1T1G4_9MICO|nr:LLM class F420-dependent oxidoreductase [Salinibacterium hongtaonis]PWB97719.1 LLM class F420-dependent oxidoreductase [Salinibacterium hongtaonis]
MRFGMFIPQGWRHDLVGIDPAEQWHAMSALAAEADAGEWESIWVYDHFHTVPVATDQATHEAWTLMSAFAATTSRVRLGQMCTCMSYRNPAYLAKVAATVDLISGGRVEMGIGAGWYEHEWRAYGYGFPRPGERLARLDEGVQIMKQAWQTGSATLDGAHYQVENAIVRPLPLQDGGPPVWIAGGGEKVTLRIAAKYADYTNFAGDPAQFAAKSELLREHCAAEGTDFDRIVRSANYNTLVAENEHELGRMIDAIEARIAPHIGPAEAAKYVAEYRDGTALVGTPQQVTDRLGAMGDLGLAYAIHYFADVAYDRTSALLFEREVMPALR